MFASSPNLSKWLKQKGGSPSSASMANSLPATIKSAPKAAPQKVDSIKEKFAAPPKEAKRKGPDMSSLSKIASRIKGIF